MSAKASLRRLQFSNFKLDTLLDITLSINENLPVKDLLHKFESILRHELNIGKVLLFRYNQKWERLLSSGIHRNVAEGIRVETDLLYYNQITNLSVALNPNLQFFDAIIPVYHHETPIAYVLIGDIDEERAGMSPTIKHLHFIQTMANIIVVAIENKRLFDENVRQEAIRKELELASRMQNMLIPNPASLPNNEKIHASAYYLPHFEVGGDYYDFIKLNNEEYAFCMADVSGKGISAALLMSNFQANVRALFSANLPLPLTINKLNDRVMENANGEKFITLFLGKFNIITRELEYINAGHNPSLLYFGDTKKLVELSDGCTGVGMLDEIPHITLGKEILAPGSKLICYTDGIVELENDDKVEFGSKIMEQCMVKNDSINSIIDEIIEKLNDHKGDNDFFDDISLMGIEFH
ncbi:MAG: PP2C family protein-serine/threonine phosphatase [Salinivirgaceae bacterium]|jgi:sigma-B regulation protein RsbU (phosphoserine phosphatase)|nr:PP2C family protein-serine/threonine phosphatase [Salinivirgaceae bacterium]